MQKTLLTCFCLLLSIVMQAATIDVKGVVTDAQGLPLPGVTVVVKNENVGMTTDLDGRFSIQVGQGKTLVFSYIGYRTKEIQVADKTLLDIVLEEDNKILDEVVVVGYGVQKKSDVTGSIASVSAKDLKGTPNEDVGKSIQGKVSGVQVLQLSGAPGTESNFRIRGYSSNGASNPLYIVDGLRVSSISHISPENIESIEILKDAASAAIYGAQAGNGVVLITTRQGEKGKSRLFYNAQLSMQQQAKKINMMDAEEYKAFWSEAGIKESAFGTANTDWQDEMFGTGIQQKHTVGFEGANDRGSLYLALNYLDNNGMLEGDYDTNQAYAGQLNATYKINDWINVQTHNTIESRKTRSVSQNAYNSLTSVIGASYLYDPTVPLTYASDDLAPATMLAGENLGYTLLRDEQGRLYGASEMMNATMNPLAMMQQEQATTWRNSVNGTIALNLTPLKDLTITSRLGYTLSSYTTDTYYGSYWWNQGYNMENANFNSDSANSQYYQWENFANYLFNIGKQEFSVMAGMQFAQYHAHNVGGYVSKLANDADNYHNLNGAASDATHSTWGGPTHTGNISYFGRLSWNYLSRYLFQFNFRADAYDTTKLAEKSRWGYFPSVSAGWVVSQEEFMKPLTQNGALTFLKLRGSWGVNGNIDSLGGFAYASTLWLGGNNYSFSDKLITGASPSSQLANADLCWERSTQLDFGLEARFLRDRLQFGLDWYRKETTDMLSSISAPAVSGASYQYINAGKILNRGLDLELKWQDHIGDFNYSVGGNISFLHNEVLESPYGDGRYAGGGGMMTEATYFEVGYPIWYLRTYVVDHIDQLTGEPIYKTAEELGTDDGKAEVGSYIPDFTYGLNLSLGWKNWDLNVQGYGAAGAQTFLAVARVESNTLLGNLPKALVNDYWSWTNTDGSRPSPKTWANSSSMYYYGSSDHMVFNSSYFKIKNIQLGYTFPQKWIRPLHLSALRLYGSLENFFIFTNYPGNDPESMASMVSGERNSLGMSAWGGIGTDRIQYPTMKQIVFGLNVSF